MAYLTKRVSFQEDLKQEEEDGDDEIVKAKLKWEELYMAVALTASLRSKDPNTRVGCCIVDPETYTIVSTAYNGFPPGLEDTHDKWEKEAKKDYVIHAEANALVLSRANLRGAVCYVTLFPCKECAKLLTQAGIKEVTYLAYPSNSDSLPDYEVSRKIFKAGKVKLTPFAVDEKSRSYFLDKLKTQIDVTMQGLKRKEKPEETVPMRFESQTKSIQVR
ncbi:deoxycytidylate deaminase-like isoform X2 [Oscarella lobularis]|uniref:deoxycytidylate deaminase-like isoform X2 n=1 Tax=Oscarella lobularis TaxID=121494 RepID=UPI00331331B2